MATEIIAMCGQSLRQAETQMDSDTLISARKPKRETGQRHNPLSRPFKQFMEEADRQQLKLMDFISNHDSLSEQDNQMGIQAQSNADTIVEQQCNGNPRKYNKSGGIKGGGGKEKQPQESRRRLARGPRSGGATVASETMQNMFLAPSEDHRVVSTEYQSSGTQVLMRVTLLAAGFVIGAKGNSARMIGQTTGAVVQSWTETNCGDPDAVPIRLFRIQGKKTLVQAAVDLIEQAVAKYRELCECKRRGEFVQREHVINGVEFYYQPPPKKAFEHDSQQKLSNSYEEFQPESYHPRPNLRYHTNLHTDTNSDHNHHTISKANPNIPPGFNRHYPKYPNPSLHVHGEKHNVMGLHIAHPLAFPRNDVWAMPQFHSAHQRCNLYDNHYQRHDDINILALNMNVKVPGRLFDRPGSNHHQEDQLISSQNTTSDMTSKEEVQVSDLKINKLNQIGVDNQEEKCSIRNPNENKVVDPWLLLVQHRHEQMSSSLFSFFGYGELPVPVAPGQAQSKAPESLSTYVPSTTGFDFSSYNFLGGRFPAFSFASAINSKTHPMDTVLQGSEEQLMCALCIHQQAGLCFTGCKHCVCASCVEGTSKCPLCGKENQSTEQLDSEGAAYHLWNCLLDICS